MVNIGRRPPKFSKRSLTHHVHVLYSLSPEESGGVEGVGRGGMGVNSAMYIIA